jgi:hypothetical protein
MPRRATRAGSAGAAAAQKVSGTGGASLVPKEQAALAAAVAPPVQSVRERFDKKRIELGNRRRTRAALDLNVSRADAALVTATARARLADARLATANARVEELTRKYTTATGRAGHTPSEQPRAKNAGPRLPTVSELAPPPRPPTAACGSSGAACASSAARRPQGRLGPPACNAWLPQSTVSTTSTAATVDPRPSAACTAQSGRPPLAPARGRRTRPRGEGVQVSGAEERLVRQAERLISRALFAPARQTGMFRSDMPTTSLAPARPDEKHCPMVIPEEDRRAPAMPNKTHRAPAISFAKHRAPPPLISGWQSQSPAPFPAGEPPFSAPATPPPDADKGAEPASEAANRRAGGEAEAEAEAAAGLEGDFDPPTPTRASLWPLLHVLRQMVLTRVDAYLAAKEAAQVLSVGRIETRDPLPGMSPRVRELGAFLRTEATLAAVLRHETKLGSAYRLALMALHCHFVDGMESLARHCVSEFLGLAEAAPMPADAVAFATEMMEALVSTHLGWFWLCSWKNSYILGKAFFDEGDPRPEAAALSEPPAAGRLSPIYESYTVLVARFLRVTRTLGLCPKCLGFRSKRTARHLATRSRRFSSSRSRRSCCDLAES